MHSSHHHLHSRFLKSSHISVTIATILSPSRFRCCLFLFFNPSHLSLSLSLSTVNITEPPQACSVLFMFWHSTEKRGLFGGWGEQKKSWSEVSTRRFLTPRTVKMLSRDSSFSTDAGRIDLISARNLGIQHHVHKGKWPSSVFSSNKMSKFGKTEDYIHYDSRFLKKGSHNSSSRGKKKSLATW